MVKIVSVNGFPGAGKSEFERLCKEKCNLFQRTKGFTPEKELLIDITSTVDFVKEIAYECGWDGVKTLESRRFLSDLKDLLTNWNDVPFKTIMRRAETLPKTNDWIMFVDCREPTEIQKMKEQLNATTLLIRRPGDENISTSNHADSEVLNYNYDLTIHNNSDIIDLSKKAEEFIEYMRGAPNYEYDN